MRNNTVQTLSFLAIGVLCVWEPVLGQAEKNTNLVVNAPVCQYSTLASELIAFYTPRITPESRYKARALWSPDLSQEHLTEKYRAAWGELILAVVTEPRDNRVLRIRPQIYGAICAMAKPESVPVLKEALMRSAASGVDQKKMVRAQEYILSALTVVCSTNALDAILSSLDDLDVVYGTNKPLMASGGVTLRDKTFKNMINTNSYELGLQNKSQNERTEAWKSIITKYQEEKGLSQKNRGLAERAKAYKRPEKAMRD